MMIQIVTAGRKDVDDFFKLSDVFTAERLNHTPLIVFIATADAYRYGCSIMLTSCCRSRTTRR